MNYLLALLIAHIIGVLHSFLWNKYWIFKSRHFRFLEFIKFNVIYAIVFIVNAIALFVCVEIIQVNPRLAQLLLLPVITMISFFGQKLWTFNEKIDSVGDQN
jgi:putative flippase GtrA